MATKNYSGIEVEVDDDGHLVDRSTWSKELAEAIAKDEGIEALTDKHWTVLEFMRKVYDEEGSAPSMRKINKQSGVNTKELYSLFPDGPAKKAARIAGLPKPKGCI